MAAPRAKSSPQDSLLSCPVCMDIYKTPRMLPCQHTLCETCLHSYIVNKSKERVLVSDFPCPVCRASTPTPRAFTRIDTWASLFPLNHLLVSLLDSSFQEMIERNEQGHDHCPEHAGKSIEFFCTEHGEQVCSKCFKNSHRQCDIIDIEDHIEFKSRFGTVKADLDNVQKYLNEAIVHIKNNIEQLLSQKSAIITEVKDFRSKVETLLNSFETDIKDQVNVQHDGEVVVLKAQCEKYERIKADVEASENALVELPVSGNIAQSLESISTLENELKSHMSFIKGCHSNIKLIKLEFAIENQLLSFLNSFSQIGNVYVNHFDANLRKPPELLSRGSTHNESFVPSPRDIIDDTQSPANVRHLSPRSAISARPPVSNANQRQATQTPPRNIKQPKRPLTVPIESTTPAPLVLRPRAERPDVHAIPHFLPRSFSSPVNESLAVGINTREVANRNTQREQEPINVPTLSRESAARSQNKPENQILSSSPTDGDPESPVFSPVSEADTSDVPNEENCRNRRLWHYANIRPDPSDALPIASNSDNSNSTEAKRPHIQLLRARSASASDIAPETTTKDATLANRIVRNFHEKQKQRENNSSSPLYENTAMVNAQPLPISSGLRNADFQSETPATSSNSTIAKQCVKVKDVCVHIQCDSHECTITGSVELSDQRLILIDCNNSRVKLLSKEFVNQAHMDMAKEPWNVAATAANEVAVTVPLEKAIHIIRVLESSMEKLRCIGTRRECWGICFVDGKFAVTTKEDGNMVVFLDTSGRELQVVNFASRENPTILRPVSVAAAVNDNVLYVSCEGQTGTRGSVVRMSPRGDVLYVYTNKELDRPYSITVDRNSNVFVTAIRSANVMMVSEGGAKVMTMLSRENGLCRPQHIQTVSTETNTRFILSERRVDTLSVYEVK